MGGGVAGLERYEVREGDQPDEGNGTRSCHLRQTYSHISVRIAGFGASPGPT
jgi:hypothetical protein